MMELEHEVDDTDTDEALEPAFQENPSIEMNPLPVGGRAALGAVAGLAVATLGTIAWAKLAHDAWDPNRVAELSADGVEPSVPYARYLLAAASLVGAAGGALILSKRSKGAAAIGAALGTAIGQIPFIIDPRFPIVHPILGNVWQFGLPVAGAVLGANLVKR